MHKIYKRIFKAFFLIALFFAPSFAFASVAGEVDKANDLYAQGKFDDSLKLYEAALDQDNNSPVVNYDLGTALYKKGDYSKALGYLEQAAEDKSVKINPQAEYNLGNALYKAGIQKENTDIDAAIKSLRQALGDYGQTIAQDPKDEDAIFNRDFVKKEIERLKQKKQQQQQQKQQQNQQNQQQQQNQKNQQQQQGGQSQQQNQNQQQQQNRQNQQNQQNAGQQQNKQNQQQQESGQQQQNQPSASQQQQQAKAQESQQESQKEIDRQQAEDLLEEYQENEEPKKLLNYMPQKIDNRPVLKDW